MPTNLLEARGAFKNHPERKKEREFEAVDGRPLGDPPAHFDEAQRACWNEIVEDAIPGLLCRSDRRLVEKAAELLAQSRNWIVVEDAIGTRYATRPMTDGQLAMLIKITSLFGGDPSSRTKIKVPEQKPSNSFGKLG